MLLPVLTNEVNNGTLLAYMKTVTNQWVHFALSVRYHRHSTQKSSTGSVTTTSWTFYMDNQKKVSS